MLYSIFYYWEQITSVPLFLFMKLLDFFKEDGLLKQYLPEFEYRKSQEEMAIAVNNAILNKSHILIEAGTGIGKSFAYLVPAILYSISVKKPVVVTTKTKALQLQMIKKDLPFLKKLFHKQNSEFKFEVLYGSNNYLCKFKLNEFLKEPNKELFVSDVLYNSLGTFLEDKNFSGLRQDINFKIPYDIWKKINRDNILCRRTKCPYYEECFYYKNIKRISTANILVVNHHLFFANISMGNKLLPKFAVFVFDEAHSFENVASDFLATSISENDINYLLSSLLDLLHVADINSTVGKEKFTSAVRDFKKSLQVFFTYIRTNFKNNFRFKDEILNNDILHDFNEFIKLFNKNTHLFSGEEELIERLNIVLANLVEIYVALKNFIEFRDKSNVFWVSFEQSKRFVNLKYVPVNISELLKTKIFEFFDTAVLTSATLSTNKNFKFIKSRIGLEKCDELILKSEFNYKEQVAIYVNKKIPIPRFYDKYVEILTDEIHKLVTLTSGRAFVLFTSYKTLKDVQKRLMKLKLPFTFLIQNEEPFWKLIEKFKKDISSILMGTLSFWEGVDVPGESLSSVIITRLPFEMPDDPITSARIEFIRSNNGNPFMQYQVPTATILLKQGFGRLIRNFTDKGIVAILDSRILTKSYGKIFLNSLPECTITDNLEVINKIVKS